VADLEVVAQAFVDQQFGALKWRWEYICHTNNTIKLVFNLATSAIILTGLHLNLCL